MNKLSIWVPLMPPSKNKTFFIDDKKIIHYRPEARNFLTEFRSYVGRNFFEGLQKLNQDPEVKYKLTIIYYWERLTTKTPSAKNYYKIVDVSGRLVLVEDAFKQVTGIDDYHNFDVIIKKREGSPGMKIIYEELDEEEYERECIREKE